MSATDRPRGLRHDLRAVWADGLAWSFMVGIGESYIPAFALAIGAPSVAVGLVATVPMLIGATAQLLAPRLVEKTGSQRRWVIGCATVQALAFVPMAAAAALGAMPWPLLYLVAALYWASGLAAGPAWIGWVDSLVPAHMRVRYFARRSRWMHVLQLSGLVAGGWILQAGERLEHPLLAFALVFLFATLARTLSAAYLSTQSEPEPLPAHRVRVSIVAFVERFRHSDDGRLLVYMISVQLAQQFSGPYFTPYMLDVLELDYVEYMGLLGAAVFAKFATLPLHARLSQRYGTRAVLWIGGVSICPSAALWLVSTDYRWLFCAQLFAGAAWSAYELATFLLFFDSIDRSERASVLTTHNAANALAITIGSVAGGLVLGSFGATAEGYRALLAGSTALRLGTLFLLRRVVPRPRPAFG